MKYHLCDRDQSLVAAASALVAKISDSHLLNPAQLVSVNKLAELLRRFPKVTKDVNVQLSVVGPRRKFGDIETYYYWDIESDFGTLNIKGGGHFYRPSTGGDTFSIMFWQISPNESGELNEHLECHSIVPDILPFEQAVEAMDFIFENYKIEISDSDNSLLEDMDDYEEENCSDGEDEFEDAAEEEGEGKVAWSVFSCDLAEEQLARQIKPEIVNQQAAITTLDPGKCDFCKCLFSERGLYVDGRVRGGIMWANMCAHCFQENGVGIAWGTGQLYAKQPNGQWRCVAGFDE